MAASTKCELLFCAGDSISLTSDKDPKAIAETLSRNLDTCNDWLVDNLLSLHLGKTEARICATKQKTKKHRRLYSQMQRHNNQTTTEVKYLGVYRDNSLSGEGI